MLTCLKTNSKFLFQSSNEVLSLKHGERRHFKVSVSCLVPSASDKKVFVFWGFHRIVFLHI